MAKLPPALAKTSVSTARMSKEELARERRGEILTRVIDVFAKRGYQGATIDSLVVGGKTSMGVFYKLFDGKEDCFVQAFDLVLAEAEAGAREALGGSADWGGLTSRALLSLLQFAAARPFAARLVLIEAQSGGPEAVRRYADLLTAASAMLRAGRAEPAAPPDLPDSFEEATVSGVVWLLQTRLAQGEPIEAPRLHPQLAKMVLEPYLGRRELTAVLAQTASSR